MPKGKIPPQLAKHLFKKNTEGDPPTASTADDDGKGVKKSGQDDAILGATAGKPGGHAGYGKGVASYGTEAEEESKDAPDPISKQKEGMDDEAGGSQTSSGAEKFK